MITLTKARLSLPAIDFIDPRLLAQLIGEALRPLSFRWLEEKALPLSSAGGEKVSSTLSAEEKKYLANVWKDLPRLRFARSGGKNLGLIITAETFRPYVTAFEQAPDRPPWSLHVRVHVSAADQFEVQQRHEQQLRREIEAGTLIALTRHHIPSAVWSEVSVIQMVDAIKYATRCGIDVSDSDETESQSILSPEPAPDSGGSAMPAALVAGMTKREQQILAIIAAAKAAGFDPLKIPTGGKSKLRAACKTARADLFSGGNSPFDGAWKEAGATRISLADRGRYTGTR